MSDSTKETTPPTDETKTADATDAQAQAPKDEATAPPPKHEPKATGKAKAKDEPEATAKAKAVNGLYVVARFTDSVTGETIEADAALPESIASDATRVDALKRAGVLSDKPRSPTVGRVQTPGGALSVTHSHEGAQARGGTGDVGARADNTGRAVKADVGA